MIDEKFLEGIGITDKDTVQKITETYDADIKAEQDAAAAVQTQLDEASKTIQSYKDMDIDGIKASVADYKQKLEQSEADRAAFEYRTKLSQYVKGLQLKNDVYEKHESGAEKVRENPSGCRGVTPPSALRASTSAQGTPYGCPFRGACNVEFIFIMEEKLWHILHKKDIRHWWTRSCGTRWSPRTT